VARIFFRTTYGRYGIAWSSSYLSDFLWRRHLACSMNPSE